MLQLEAAGVPFSEMKQERLLISGSLTNRNDSSVPYRLRHIFNAIQERGEAILKARSAAPQVGKNANARIHGLLGERQRTLRAIGQMVGGRCKAEVVDLEDVLAGSASYAN